MKYKVLYGLLLLAGWLVSCSESNNDDINQQDQINEKARISEILAEKGLFQGVWTVSQVPADTMQIAFNTLGNWAIYFYEFPFKAVTKRILPSVKVTEIYAPGLLQLAGSPDQNGLLEKTSNLYSNAVTSSTYSNGNYLESCLFPYFYHQMEMVGYSNIKDPIAKGYFEFPKDEEGTYRYLPYVVVSEAEGDARDCFAVILNIITDKSVVTVDATYGQITCILTIGKVELLYPDGSRKKLNLAGEVEMKFISTKKIESWSGN